MKSNRVSVWAAWVCVLGAAVLLRPEISAQTGNADLLLHNGKILTVDADFSTAQAVAIQGQTIRAVGSNASVLPLAGPNTLVIDLKGKTVIPGLIDTHSHIYNYAQSAYGGALGPEELGQYPIDWRAVRTKEDVLTQIKSLIEKYQFKPGQWIYFSGIGGGSLAATKMKLDELNRWELDKVSPDNPIGVSIINDLNAFLINSKAIEILWKEHGDFIKKYGKYWVDSRGEPDGHVEPPASRIVYQLLGGGSPEDLAPVFKKYMEEWSAQGVTTVSSRMPDYALNTYQLLESRGEMPLRMGYGKMSHFGLVKDMAREFPALSKLVGTGSDILWITSASPTAVDGASTRACTGQQRISAYGALDSWFPVGQCHMDVEYRGGGNRGAPLSGNYFREWIENSARYGLRLANTHVAGDRSHALLLTMMEQLQQQYGPDALQGWAFDHCSMVNPADLPRAGRLGVTFSCIPSLNGAAGIAESYGDEVAHNFLKPVKSMLNAGAKVVYELDTDGYAWTAVETFITRKDANGKVWGPHERLDRITTLKTITRWAAEYVLKPDKLGSIEPGKLADIVVLSQDYLTIPEDNISDLHSRLTILNGKIIYVHDQFAQEYNLRPAGAIVSTYEALKARRTPKTSGEVE